MASMGITPASSLTYWNYRKIKDVKFNPTFPIYVSGVCPVKVFCNFVL